MTKQKTLGILLVVSALAIGTGTSFTNAYAEEIRTAYFASGDIRFGINSDVTDDRSKIGYYSVSGLDGMRNLVHVCV